MSDIDKIISEFRDEADIDFIDISLIAGAVEEDLKLQNQEEIRNYTLEIIKGLMTCGVYPGDYDYGTHISFWPGTPDDLLKRIGTEWIALGKPSDRGASICWFGLRPSGTA